MKSLLSSVLALLLTVILVFSFTACDLFNDGDDDDDDNIYNPTLADQLYEQGNYILQETLYMNIVNSGGPKVHVETLDLDDVKTLYTQALEQDGTHSGAHLGLGAIELLELYRDERSHALVGGLHSHLIEIRVILYFLLNFEPYSHPDSGFTSFATSPLKIARSLMALDDDDLTTPTGMQQKIRDLVLPTLDVVINHFGYVWADQDFQFIITPRMQGNADYDNIEIDRTDIAAALFALNATKAILNHYIAYNYDMDRYNTAEVITLLSPGSPYLALNPTGVQEMATALGAWQNAVDFLETGLDLLESETDYQGNDLIWIDPYDPELLQDIEEIRNEIPRLRNLLDESAEIEFDMDGDGFDEESITVSLHNYYTTPVEDWKEKLPVYSVTFEENENGYLYLVLEWEVDSFYDWNFPDPTFNGLFPGMTNARIKELFLQGNDWTKTISGVWYI